MSKSKLVPLTLLFFVCQLAWADEAPSRLETVSGEHLLLRISKRGHRFHVVETTRVMGKLPIRRNSVRSHGWRYALIANGNRVVFEGRLRQPGTLRGEFASSDGSTIESVKVNRLDDFSFMIRIPALVNPDETNLKIEFSSLPEMKKLGTVSLYQRIEVYR
jgi:hypothetical protein